MMWIRICVQAMMLFGFTTLLEADFNFGLSSGYESMTSEEKQEELWNIIISANDTSAHAPTFMDLATFAFGDKLSLSYTAETDNLPHNHIKRIHTIGGIAKATYTSVGNHTYSGMFQGDSDAIVRFSNAQEPTEDSLGSSPGIGLKLLRDGIKSADLVAMFSLVGQEGGNFFKNRQFNHVHADQVCSKPEVYWLGHRFNCSLTPPTIIGLNNFAIYDQAGGAVESSDVQFPFKLIFEPNSELTDRFAGASVTSTKDQLTSIESGIKLFDVYALSGPDAEEAKIAELHLDSEIVYSKAGDEFVFFHHEDPHVDLEYHPEWHDAFYSTRVHTISPCPVYLGRQ